MRSSLAYGERRFSLAISGIACSNRVLCRRVTSRRRATVAAISPGAGAPAPTPPFPVEPVAGPGIGCAPVSDVRPTPSTPYRNREGGGDDVHPVLSLPTLAGPPYLPRPVPRRRRAQSPQPRRLLSLHGDAALRLLPTPPPYAGPRRDRHHHRRSDLSLSRSGRVRHGPRRRDRSLTTARTHQLHAALPLHAAGDLHPRRAGTYGRGVVRLSIWNEESDSLARSGGARARCGRPRGRGLVAPSSSGTRGVGDPSEARVCGRAAWQEGRPGDRLDEGGLLGHGLDPVTDPRALEGLVDLREGRPELLDGVPFEGEVVRPDQEGEPGGRPESVRDIERGDPVRCKVEVDVTVHRVG